MVFCFISIKIIYFIILVRKMLKIISFILPDVKDNIRMNTNNKINNNSIKSHKFNKTNNNILIDSHILIVKVR